MADYLRRLATTGAAYTAASVVSKLIAVALLPLYTRYLTPADYGAAEVMFAAVVAVSILIRLGVIEALLRFYYLKRENSARVVSTSFALLFWAGAATVALAMPFAGPISELLLAREDAALARVAILGLWVLTLSEYLLTLFRLDERAKAYFTVTIVSALATIVLTVALVVFAGQGAMGVLVGSYAVGAVAVIALSILHWRRLSLRLDLGLLRRMLRFGLPTMPAELSLYSLNFIDRIIIVRFVGLAEAGLYSLAVKFAQAVNILARGFHLAWPPLAYSITDDGEARRFYSLVVTWFSAFCAFVVVGLWLLARWILRALAAPEYFEAFEAVGLISAGAALYGLYMVQVVILGRTGRTEFNLPATFAATAANVGLNLILVPPYGIVGAGLALVLSYVVVLGLMYAFTQRLFPIPYEWGRLVRVLFLAALVIAAGELVAPAEGLPGLAARLLFWAAYPLLLLVTGFLNPQEREYLPLLVRPRELAARLNAAARSQGPG